MKILKTLAASALMLGMTATVMAAPAPKYVFYFIGDGMGHGQVMATQAYTRLVQNDVRPLVMTQMPVASLAYTYSFSSPVTDSAAAGTALSTGTKTRNGMLGMNPDTVSVTSMAEILKQAGYGIGLVTTVAPDDATPAAFYAHVPNRGMFYEIEKQYASSGFDFLAGAGLRGLTDGDGNPTDILDIYEKSGIDVVYGADSVKYSTSDKIVLLSPNPVTSSNVGYNIDSIEGAQKLSGYTQACLDHLQKVSPDKFFMMVEGGTIDHAGHANDGGGVIKEVIAFDQALEIAYNFYKQHPDETLIVVTADHETGGMTVGCAYTGYNSYPAVFDRQKVSKEEFSAYCKSVLRSKMIYTWDDMKAYLEDKLGFWTHLRLRDWKSVV